MFNTLIIQPLANALIFFYNTTSFQDLGVAIIFLTLLIRIILFPIFHKGAKHQAMMQKIQPKMREIQSAHKDNKEVQVKKMMELYREHKINPLSSIFFLAIQIPVIIGLYKIFLMDFSSENFAPMLYSFISNPTVFSASFLGLLNLHEPSIIMVGLAAIAQYFHGRLAFLKHPKHKGETQAEKMARSMVVMGPILTVLIFAKLPAAVGLYWLTTSIFSVGQQIVVNKSTHNNEPGGMETILRNPPHKDGV